MSAKRGASGLSGVLLVDKPSGITSHDVVNRMRRATNERRIGHAGTLDPMATGLLVILVGPATRLAPYLTSTEKVYQATISFGAETDTDDAEGEVVRQAAVPAEAFDAAYAAQVLDGFLGESLQTPPIYSAIKLGGVVAHRAAREGEPLELDPRPIDVRSATLTAIDAQAHTWTVEFAVSKGTYVRALARDIGRALGSAAHLAGLRRVRSGVLDVSDAVPLKSIENADDAYDVAEMFTDPIAAVGLPTIEVSEDTVLRIAAGQALDPETHCGGVCPPEGPVALTHDGTLLAIYESEGDALRAQTVIPGGVRAGERP